MERDSPIFGLDQNDMVLQVRRCSIRSILKRWERQMVARTRCSASDSLSPMITILEHL